MLVNNCRNVSTSLDLNRIADPIRYARIDPVFIHLLIVDTETFSRSANSFLVSNSHGGSITIFMILKINRYRLFWNGYFILSFYNGKCSLTLGCVCIVAVLSINSISKVIHQLCCKNRSLTLVDNFWHPSHFCSLFRQLSEYPLAVPPMPLPSHPWCFDLLGSCIS